MTERTTSMAAVVAGGLWVTALIAFMVAAVVMALGPWPVALLVAEGACIVSAFAATMHIRCYAIRGFDLVRNLHRGEEAMRVPLQRIP